MIVPYIAENLRPYVTWPPIRSCGDWGQSQFQLGGDDESTYQILSNGLLFSTFYHFPYTADPPTSTMLMQPSPTITWTIVRSPSTIPYTHHTIGPVPHRRPPIWPMDHIVIFSFLSLFPITQRILSWPNQPQVVTPHDRDLTIRFATHEPCAHFTYHLYLRLLYLLWKTRKFSPELRLKFVLSYCFALLRLAPSLYFTLSTHFALSHHIKPSSHTTSHSLILHQETISLTPLRTT